MGMTRGSRVSASAVRLAAVGCGGPQGELGRAAGPQPAGLVFSFFFSFFFFKSKFFSNPNKLQTNSEFKPRFESSNQKQCTSMHATVNSYISLIN
jgi:hypothetical protein